MEKSRKKDRDKKSKTSTKNPPSDVTSGRKRVPSLHDTHLNKSKHTQLASNYGNNEVASGGAAERSFPRSSPFSPSALLEPSRASSVKNGPAKAAVDISDYVHDNSVWEAMEIRFLDKGKCTVLRPNLSSVLSSAEASATSQCSAKNSNPSAIVYPRAHLLNAPLPLRRQKVCVEKVHVRNLLNTKREKCGNLSSSRLSEYMPHVSGDPTKRCHEDKEEFCQISKSDSSCVTDTDTSDSGVDSSVLRSTVDIKCNKRAHLNLVNGPDNTDQHMSGSRNTLGFQKCSYISRSRESNEVMDKKESPSDNQVYCRNIEGIIAHTDNKKIYHANQLKSSTASKNPAFVYRKCSNLEEGKGPSSKFDLAEKSTNQECSTQLSSTYQKSMPRSPSRSSNAHISSTDDDCCVSAEKPTHETRRIFAKNPSFGSAESSFECVSNKLCQSDTPAKRYTGSDKTSDLFNSNISSEAWIKYCTGCFPRDNNEARANDKKGRDTKNETSHQSADRDSSDFSEQATLSGTSKTKTPNMQAAWPAQNTPSAVDNYSAATLSSAADKTSLAATPKPKDKGDQSISIIGAKSSVSSFSPLTEAEIARYKEIALEILMQRKKNQGHGTEIKAYRDYSLLSAHRKKRQSSAQLQKVTHAEKPQSTKPSSKKSLPDKVEKHRSSSTGRLPRPESVNDRTIFWASQRIRNQIEKHKQRLLQTNKAKSTFQTGIHSLRIRKTDTKTSSTITSNPSNTDHKETGNTKEKNEKALHPILSAATSEASFTVTSITADVKHPNNKMSSLLSLEEGKPKQLIQSLPGFKNTLTTGATTERSPGKSDWGSSVNLESDNGFPGAKALSLETQTDESQENVISDYKSGDTGHINPKLMYLDKLNFKDNMRNYAKEPTPNNLRSTHKDSKTNVSYGHCAHQTIPRLSQEDAGAVAHEARQAAQPTRYLDLLQNILKSPTSKTTQALSMFLQKPKALAEAERDLDITVDQIISSYQEIFEELRSDQSKQKPLCNRPSMSSSPKKNCIPHECSVLGADALPNPGITYSASSCERFSKQCGTKYDSVNTDCHHDPVNPTGFSCDKESREGSKCEIASNRTTPDSCNSSNLKVAIVSPTSQAALPHQRSSFSSLKANKRSTFESTSHRIPKAGVASNKKSDVTIYNKAQSQLSIHKKNNFKMDISKRPVKVSSNITHKSNALERPILEKNNTTSKPTINALRKKCASLTAKGSSAPTGSKSTTGDYCPKYQRDLAKWMLEKENNQFELLMQSFQQSLLSSEHETLTMQHTRPAITIIAPQACLNISSTVMPDANKKEAESEKTTSNKKSFTDTHLLQSVEKRQSLDSFLQTKQVAAPPVVCKTRLIRTFPLCKRESKKKITTSLPQGKKEEKANEKKEDNVVEKPIERVPSHSTTSQSSVLKTLNKNAGILQLRKSCSADCTATNNQGLSKKEQGKENLQISGQLQKEDSKVVKSDIDNYVVQVISSSKNTTNFENGPFDLDKSGAVNTLKITQTKSVSRSQPTKRAFVKQKSETKIIETKLKTDGLKTKFGEKLAQRSSPKQTTTKEATKSASASSFNERGKFTQIQRRQRASKNQDTAARKKLFSNAAPPRSASCPPGRKEKQKLPHSATVKEVTEEPASNTHETLGSVENNFQSISPNTTHECEDTFEFLEYFNSRSGPQNDESCKKPGLKLEGKKVCSEEENKMQPKLATISTPTIAQDTIHMEYTSHDDVKDRVDKTPYTVFKKSEDLQEQSHAGITSLDPVAVTMVVAPNDTIAHISSQSSVKIVPSSINDRDAFSAFPLAKRNYEAHVDGRYVESASEKWQGRPAMSWKQTGSEEDSESEGMSLQAMRRQAVARTCEMLIRESKTSDKNRTEFAGDFLAVNKFCNLQRSTEAYLGLKTPTKWWPPELLSKTGWLMSSLRTDLEHNVATKSTLSQDTLDSLAPINAETGEEDEESVDFLKSVSSLRMCCKTQIMKDLTPMSLSKYIDLDSIQEDNVRLITTADDQTDLYSPALTCDDSAEKKERINDILSNDKLAQGEEPYECFRTRELHTLKCNQQFNENLQPKCLPLVETSDERIDFFSGPPFIQSTFGLTPCGLQIKKSESANIEELNSTVANSAQLALFPDKLRVDITLDNNTEVLCELGRVNRSSEAVSSKETVSNIGDTVMSLSSLFRDDGSVPDPHIHLDKIFSHPQTLEEKYAQNSKREIVETAATVQEETPTRLHTIEDTHSIRTKSASDTKKSTTETVSSVLKQERGLSYIDVVNNIPFLHDSKSSSIQFESHPFEQTSGEEKHEIVMKDIKKEELLTDMIEGKLEEHLLDEACVSMYPQSPEKCDSVDGASISLREYSSVDVNRLCRCLSFPEDVNVPPTCTRDDESPHGLITLEELSLLFPVETHESVLSVDLDSADTLDNRTEHEKGNAYLEIKVDSDKCFKDSQCQTGPYPEMEMNPTGVELKDPADKRETQKCVTKWTMTSDQEITFERVTPTFYGEKNVSILGDSPSVQENVSLSAESVKNVVNEPYLLEQIAHDGVAKCPHCFRQCANSYIQNDRPNSDSFLKNNAGSQAEPYLSTRECRDHCTGKAERNTAAIVNAPEVKMRIRIELSGDHSCQCNKIKDSSHSEDNQNNYPCCSFPLIFNTNKDSVQELTLHLGPLPKNSWYKNQQVVEPHDDSVVTSLSKLDCHLELPSLMSESEIRTRPVEINHDSPASLVPTPHSCTDANLYAEDFNDTGLTSKAVSDFEDADSVKIDSFRGLPATLFNHENLNVFSETENLYSRGSRRASNFDGKYVHAEGDRSHRIFYCGVSPERSYRRRDLEENTPGDITSRETRLSPSKDISGSTNVTDKTNPERGGKKGCTMDDEKYFTSPAASPQTRHSIPCESLKQLAETKSPTSGFNEDERQTNGRTPEMIHFSKTAKEKLKNIEILRVDLETLAETVLSSDDSNSVRDHIDRPKRDLPLCNTKFDGTENLKIAEENKAAVETKEVSDCSSFIRKLSRNRKINESLIQQKAAENLEMFIKSMRELKRRQSRRSPHFKPNSCSCINPVCRKLKSLTLDLWASKSTLMSKKAEMNKSLLAPSSCASLHSFSSSTERSFSRLKGFRGTMKSPPKTKFSLSEQLKIHPFSNNLDSTASLCRNKTMSLPTVSPNGRTTKSPPAEIQHQVTVGPNRETGCIKKLVFKSSVGLVSEASAITNDSIQLFKEFETNSESGNTDITQGGFPRTFKAARGIDKLITNESPLFDSNPGEQHMISPTDYCSVLRGMSSQKHESKNEFFKLKHENPTINSWNPFLKSSNPFIADGTAISPTAELIPNNSTPHEYFSFPSRNGGGPIPAYSNVCSPMFDLLSVFPPQTQNGSGAFEESDQFLFISEDLWFSHRDDTLKTKPRGRSGQELLVGWSGSQSMESASSCAGETGNDEPIICMTPKVSYICTPVGNESVNMSPGFTNGVSYNERDPFEFPIEHCATLLVPPGHEIQEVAKEVQSKEMFDATGTWLAESDNILEKDSILYPFHCAEFKKKKLYSKNLEPFKCKKILEQSSGPCKYVYKELRSDVSCSNYYVDLKEVSPVISRSTLCLDDSPENNESSYPLACSETPLLPHKECARDIYLSSVSSLDATRVSSVYGEDESEVVSVDSKATQIDLLDSIETLTCYLMETYIKVKDKVKRQYLRKNKTKHKRLHNFGIHNYNLFRAMFLSNHIKRKSRFAERLTKRGAKTTPLKKLEVKYSLLKEEKHSSCVASKVVVSECSSESSSTHSTHQYYHRCGRFGDSQPIGSYQDAFPVVKNNKSLSLSVDSTSCAVHRKPGKLVEGKQSNEKSLKYVKELQENNVKHLQVQGKHSRDLSPVRYCESSELSHGTSHDSTFFNEDLHMKTKFSQRQDISYKYTTTEHTIGFDKTEEPRRSQSSSETFVLNSRCFEIEQDSNLVRCQESTKCSRLHSEDDKKNFQSVLLSEKFNENKFYLGNISPCTEEDETKKEITFQDDTNISQTIFQIDELVENGIDVGKDSKSSAEEATKTVIVLLTDCEKRSSYNSFLEEKSAENKALAGQSYQYLEKYETRNKITFQTEKDINNSPSLSHKEDSVENTSHVGTMSCLCENKSSKTVSHIEKLDGNKGDVGKNDPCPEEGCEKYVNHSSSQFEDNHCQSKKHMEELIAGTKCNHGGNEVAETTATQYASDDDIECSHSITKSKPDGNNPNDGPNCKCHVEEGDNAYLCCGQNNNKKLQKCFHKQGELAANLIMECLDQYQGNSQCQGEGNNKNSKIIRTHNYTCCSVEQKCFPSLVSVDRASSPIVLDNSDAKLDNLIDDSQPTEFIRNDTDVPFEDNSGFIFCGGFQHPCIPPLHYLQALFVMLGGAETYPFAPNPEFFDAQEAMPESLASDPDTKEMDVCSLAVGESSEGFKIRTKGYRALQRENKLDKRPVHVVSKESLQQDISATQTASGFLGETQNVVYQRKMFEQDYDGEIHEVVFFTKDLVGDSGDPEKVQEPTVWCVSERNSSQKISNDDDGNLPVCCNKVVPKQEHHQLSPPKRNRTCTTSKFGKFTSPNSQRRFESADLSKDKYNTSGTRADYFRNFRENYGSRKRNLKQFSHKQIRLNRILYNDCVDQKCSPQWPSTSPGSLLRPSGGKINDNNYNEKHEIETPKPATANVCNKTYSCQGHEEWFYYKNAPIDSTLLSEMQTEFNEKEDSVEALERKVVVRSDSPIFFDDYELDTYEELGSLFTEMQESSSSVLLQDDVDQDEDKCQSHGCETMSNDSVSTNVSEPNSSIQGQRKEPNTYCTTCATTQTFLSVHNYLSEPTSTTAAEVSDKLPQPNDTERLPDSAPVKEMLHSETKDVRASSSKLKTTDNTMKLAPIPTSSFTQIKPQAMPLDLSVANSESSKYVYFRKVLHKCMQSESFLRYVQKIVDERLGKNPTEEIHDEVLSTPTSIPVAPKPKPRVGLANQCGKRGIAEQETCLREEIIDNRTCLVSSPDGSSTKESFQKIRDVTKEESSSNVASRYIRMQSFEDDSTDKSNDDADECRPVTCNPMSRRKMLSLRRLGKNKDTFVTKKLLSESEAHPISSSSLIIMWSDSTENPTLENNKTDTEEVTCASLTSASYCNSQHLECSTPSSQSLTSPIRKANVCDKACSVVNILSSQMPSSFKENESSLSKKKKKRNAENSKPSLSEPNMNFELEVESATKRLATPLPEVKTSESAGTLTTTSVDYGRLKNILSAETKKLWKSLTRLEKHSETCHVCRVQYNSLLTNSTDRVNFAKLGDENVSHRYHIHDALNVWQVKSLNKQHKNVCQAEASVNSKPDCIDTFQETANQTNKLQKENSPLKLAQLEDLSVITRNDYGQESMDDTAHFEELKEVDFSTIEIPLKRTPFCTDVVKPGAVAEENNYRNSQTDLQPSPNKMDIPIPTQHQDDTCCGSRANIGQNITVGKNKAQCCCPSLTVSINNVQRYKHQPEVCIKNIPALNQCQTEMESADGCSQSVKTPSPYLGVYYQKLQRNRPHDAEMKDVEPDKKSITDSTSHAQSDTADYWIERLMNILNEMHQTFPSTVTSSSVSSNMPSNRPKFLDEGPPGTQEFPGCLNYMEKKASLTDNTASYNVCELHERIYVTENSEGKSNPSSHSYVPSQTSKMHTSSPDATNKVISNKESSISQEYIKHSDSLCESKRKNLSQPNSGFLNTGVVSEPLDMRRLPSSMSIASDCHVWDQVKFSTSRENQKKPAYDPSSIRRSSFFRHSNNHTYFASFSLHYKKYQLRKSRSVPELGHISHLNKSFNAPAFMENEAGNPESNFSDKICCEMNTGAYPIRKAKSESRKEHSLHQQNCSETTLTKKQFKSTKEYRNVHATVVSKEVDNQGSTQNTEPTNTSRQDLTNIVLSNTQESSKKDIRMRSHMNESLIETDRCKVLGYTSKHDIASEQSNNDDDVELCMGQEGHTDSGNKETSVRVQNQHEAIVSVRDFFIDQKKEAALNVNAQGEGKCKPIRETRYKRATSCRSDARRGKPFLSAKNNDDGNVIHDPWKSASLDDHDQTDKSKSKSEGRGKARENSCSGSSILFGTSTFNLSTTTHRGASADHELDQGEAVCAFNTLVNNQIDTNVYLRKTYSKEEKNKISRHERETTNSLFHQKNNVVSRTRENDQGDLKMTSSYSCGTISKNDLFLCHDSEDDLILCDGPKKGAACSTTDGDQRPGALDLQNSPVTEYGVASKGSESTLNNCGGAVGSCVGNCSREEGVQKCCDDLGVGREPRPCNDVRMKVRELDCNDVKNYLNQVHGGDVDNRADQIVHKDSPHEINQRMSNDKEIIKRRTCSHLKNDVLYDIKVENNQIFGNDVKSKISLSNGNVVKSEINHLNHDCGQEEVHQSVSSIVKNVSNDGTSNCGKSDNNPRLCNDSEKEVNKFECSNVNSRPHHCTSNGSEDETCQFAGNEVLLKKNKCFLGEDKGDVRATVSVQIKDEEKIVSGKAVENRSTCEAANRVNSGQFVFEDTTMESGVRVDVNGAQSGRAGVSETGGVSAGVAAGASKKQNRNAFPQAESDQGLKTLVQKDKKNLPIWKHWNEQSLKLGAEENEVKPSVVMFKSEEGIRSNIFIQNDKKARMSKYFPNVGADQLASLSPDKTQRTVVSEDMPESGAALLRTPIYDAMSEHSPDIASKTGGPADLSLHLTKSPTAGDQAIFFQVRLRPVGAGGVLRSEREALSNQTSVELSDTATLYQAMSPRESPADLGACLVEETSIPSVDDLCLKYDIFSQPHEPIYHKNEKDSEISYSDAERALSPSILPGQLEREEAYACEEEGYFPPYGNPTQERFETLSWEVPDSVEGASVSSGPFYRKDENESNKQDAAGLGFHALEIPVDIYTLPARPTKRDSASHKKKKKKKEFSFTRTVVISGPLSNFSIPVHRHISQTEDANQVGEDDSSSKKATSSTSYAVSHKSPSCRPKHSLHKDSPQRWMSALRNFLPFRKKASDKHKQMIGE